VVLPQPTYEDYAARGESENRNKEFKCDLVIDRLSDHRFVANSFRLYLNAAAMNLLVRLRRFIAEPLPVPVPSAETAAPAASQAGEGVSSAAGEGVPAEALTGAERPRHFQLRRQRDPLGEGRPCTWRTLLIKVAAEVLVRTRRIVVRLSASWLHLDWYCRVCERLRAPLPIPVPRPSGRPVRQPVRCLPTWGKGAVRLRRPARPKRRAPMGWRRTAGSLPTRGLNNSG
jgi:hypothetical protein